MTPIEALRKAVEAVPERDFDNNRAGLGIVKERNYYRALHLAWRAAYEWHCEYSPRRQLANPLHQNYMKELYAEADAAEALIDTVKAKESQL